MLNFHLNSSRRLHTLPGFLSVYKYVIHAAHTYYNKLSGHLVIRPTFRDLIGGAYGYR